MPIPLAYNLRNIVVRRWTTAFTMGGVAMVVAATMLLAALVGGLQRMLASTGEPDNLIVLRKGATSDGASVVPREAAQALRALTGVARAPDGTPLASPEMLNQPFLHTEAGRRRWTVVGVFDSGGTAFDSEIWADLTDVLDDTRREGFVSGVRLRVAPGTDGRALARRIESDGRFTLEAKPEADYYREQAETANALYILVLTLGIAMAVGATFGALNTMYAAVAARTAEIGTLRALGFSRGAVLASFLTESCLLAAGGLLVGAALAGLAVLAINTLLSGVQFSMMTFSVATVFLRLSPGGAALGLLFATGVGVLGGLAPAWRAARLRVVDALHRA